MHILAAAGLLKARFSTLLARRAAPALVVVATLLLAAAPSAHAQGFSAVYSRNGYDVIAVGEGGALWRSLNGGFDWSSGTLGAPATLRAIEGRGNTLLVAGDGGSIWRSTNVGGFWSQTILGGTPTLRALAMADDQTWFAAGDGGTIARTVDGGGVWNAAVQGSGANINALFFADALHGWAAGDGGQLLETVDGGSVWQTRSLGTMNALLSVSQSGASVWVVGARGAAYRSTNGGASFAPVDLLIESDVRAVHLASADSVWLTGGGGFVRVSADGGATWTFQRHGMFAATTDVFTYGSRAWVTNGSNHVVAFNSGSGWLLPTGATTNMSWGTNPIVTAPGTVIGSTFARNPVLPNVLYCAMGSTIFRSPNLGNSWAAMATLMSGYTRSNAFVVSRKDSSIWLVAGAGSSVANRVLRTTNAGASWDTVLTHNFGTYGIPLEVDPDHPDTVWFGGELSNSGTPPLTTLRRSFDFGATWNPIGPNVFRSPCDIAVLHDSTNVVIVADGVTGSGRGRHWRSRDGGQTFSLRDSISGSEIPGIATSRLRPRQVLSTCWSIGGVHRSQDYGVSWLPVNAAAQSWAIATAEDDPDVILFGQYSGPTIKTNLSSNGGDSFFATLIPPLFGNSYGMLLPDRSTMLALQSSGIWKLSITYDYTPVSSAQSLALGSPVGGEVWPAGSQQFIGWSSSNIVQARVEYRHSDVHAWQPIVETEGYFAGTYWTVPLDVTDSARVRVVDAWDDFPESASADPFSIVGPAVVSTPDTLHFPVLAIGDVAVDVITIQNPGVAPLDVTSIVVSNPEFWVGRSSLVVPPLASDTVGVYYAPTDEGYDTTVVAIAASDSATVDHVIGEGRGLPSLPVLPGAGPQRIALAQNRPNPFAGVTEIAYALPRDADVRLDVFDLAGHRVATLANGHEQAGQHRVRFGAARGSGSRPPAAGVYFYRLQVGEFSATRKMLVVH